MTRLLLLLTLAVAACASSTDEPAPAPPPPPTIAPPQDAIPRQSRTPDATAKPDTSVLPALADSVLQFIEDRAWSDLAPLIHPDRGLTISPYGYIDSSAVRFMPGGIATLGSSTAPRLWGQYDGTGEPIRMPFATYYDEFIYDRPFLDVRRGAVDERLGQGNSLSNIEAFFGPAAHFVEYHAEGTERYGGMDWSSLRLVFLPYDGQWQLAGLVHDEWTI